MTFSQTLTKGIDITPLLIYHNGDTLFSWNLEQSKEIAKHLVISRESSKIIGNYDLLIADYERGVDNCNKIVNNSLEKERLLEEAIGAGKAIELKNDEIIIELKEKIKKKNRTILTGGGIIAILLIIII